MLIPHKSLYRAYGAEILAEAKNLQCINCAESLVRDTLGDLQFFLDCSAIISLVLKIIITFTIRFKVPLTLNIQ